MSTHLVTGFAGHGHVKASDQGSFNAALLGNGEFVLERGEQLRCTVVNNNCIRIYDGDILMQGRHIIVDRDTYVDTAHDNGTAGYKRIDLIVMTYSKDTATGIETAGIEVIKGEPVTGTPTVPGHVTGDILNAGASKHQMPLYKVTIDGIAMGTPVQLFKTVSTLEAMKEELEEHIKEKAEEIAEGQTPLVSNIDDAALIENYGEYAADAKMVGEEISELYKNISALNGGGAVTGIDVQEDGAYITYTLPGGADPVTKKLGSTYKVVNFNESTTYVNGSFVDLGFKPIAIYAKATGRSASFVYDETYSTTKVKENKPETSATTIGSTNCLLKSISDTGFTFNMNTSNIAYGNGNFMIFAIG